MTQQLVDLVEQFCQYQLKHRGKTEGGVQSYRWVLEQFLIFVRSRHGRLARALLRRAATTETLACRRERRRGFGGVVRLPRFRIRPENG